MKVRRAAALLALLLCGAATPRAQDEEGVRLLLGRLERVVLSGDAGAFLALTSDAANATRARDFVSTEIMPGAKRAVLHERDRQPLQGSLPGNGHSLLVEVIAEFGSRARIATWRVDVKRTGAAGSEREWTIADQERLSSVENIYRLSLNATKAFTARNLKIAAEDLDLTLPEGSVFVGDIDLGVTAVVLIGRGTLNFHPAPAVEKGQVKIFCGSETLETRFDVAYLRVNPAEFATLIDESALQPKAVDPGEMRRAQEIFREESQKSFVIDLGDLSRDAWTLLPAYGDFLAELRTRRFDTLTYARSGAEAEDITLFDRKRHRNIALYPSQDKQARRGQASYNEDDLVDYDILDYDIEVAATPDRQWIDGRARVRLKVRSFVLGSADAAARRPTGRPVDRQLRARPAVRHSRQEPEHARRQPADRAHARQRADADDRVCRTPRAAGARARDRSRRSRGSARRTDDVPMMLQVEPSFLYSSRSYWYPQAPVSDYATARIRISVPPGVECVASGELEPGFPTIVAGKEPSQNRKWYVFNAAQPLRYLAFILSRFSRAETTTIAFGAAMSARTDTPLAGAGSRPSRRSR